MKPDLKLSTHSVKRLKKLYKYDQSNRVRVRSHAVLLYHQGFNYTQIAEVLMEHKDSTISLWINNFLAIGFDALYDQKRDTHPNATFTEIDKKTHRVVGQRSTATS